MPRVTTSVRLSVDAIEGPGPLALAEVRAYQRGAAPVTAGAAGAAGAPAAAAACPDQRAQPAAIRAGRPVPARRVDGDRPVDRPRGLRARLLHRGRGRLVRRRTAAGRPNRVDARTDAAGAAVLALDIGGIPPGPFTVKVEAKRPGPGDQERVPPALPRHARDDSRSLRRAAPARGRTLVYADEFDGPLSVTRTGFGADYAAAKPTHAGVEDFGDAIFADPALGAGQPCGWSTTSILRIGVQPNPPGFADPQGWGRTRTGGLLASARQGGSGFSAQYGYFEARMLAPGRPRHVARVLAAAQRQPGSSATGGRRDRRGRALRSRADWCLPLDP